MTTRNILARPMRALAVALLTVAVFTGGAMAATAFSDVPDTHPAAAEITAAHSIGVFKGYADGTFQPDGKLTQRQAENVIWRILSWQGTDDDGNFEITRADAAVLAMTGLCGLDPGRIPACAAITSTPEAGGAPPPETGTLVPLCAELEEEYLEGCANVAPTRVPPGAQVWIRIPDGEKQCRVYHYRSGSSWGGRNDPDRWLYSGGDLYEIAETGAQLEHVVRIRCRDNSTRWVARVVVDDTIPTVSDPSR